MRSRLALLLGTIPLLGVAAYLTAGRVAAQPEGVTVTYCRDGGTALDMDLYPPPAAKRAPAPVVLYVHGGAWTSGSRRDTGDLFPGLLPRLRDAGVFAAAIDYRLAGQAPWPAPLDDLLCAGRYLQAHARALHIDPNRIELYGTSAGGQVVAMAALQHMPGVVRVVDMYGPAQLDAAGWSSWLRADIRREFGSQPLAASPTEHVTRGAPPFMIVQGDCDVIVPARQSRELAARLRAAGVPVRYVEVRGAGHALGACGGAPVQPSAAQVLDSVAAFLTS